MRLDLIDYFYLTMIPYVAGEGRRLFDDVGKYGPLDLVSSMTLRNGTLELEYRRCANLSPPPVRSEVVRFHRAAWGLCRASLRDRRERYAWLNRIQAVGKGTLNEDLSVGYEWYEVRQCAGSHAR